MGTLANVASEETPGLRTLLDAKRSQALQLLRARLQRGVTDGDLPASVDIMSTARFYLAVQQGMSIQARDGATRKVLASIATTAMAAWPVPS